MEFDLDWDNQLELRSDMMIIRSIKGANTCMYTL